MSRDVRFARSFFNSLDQQLPDNRTSEGKPSATDFLVFDLPRVRDQLADNFETVTSYVPPDGKVAVYIGSGTLVPYFVLFIAFTEAGVLDVIDIEISTQ